jgi:hypothetical protein
MNLGELKPILTALAMPPAGLLLMMCLEVVLQQRFAGVTA